MTNNNRMLLMCLVTAALLFAGCVNFGTPPGDDAQDADLNGSDEADESDGTTEEEDEATVAQEPMIGYGGCRATYLSAGVPEDNARAVLPDGLAPVLDETTGLATYGFYTTACHNVTLNGVDLGEALEMWEILLVAPRDDLQAEGRGHWFVASVTSNQDALRELYVEWSLGRAVGAGWSGSSTTLPTGGLIEQRTMSGTGFTSDVDHVFTDAPGTRDAFGFRFFAATGGEVSGTYDSTWTPHGIIVGEGAFHVTAGENAVNHPGGLGMGYVFLWDESEPSMAVAFEAWDAADPADAAS